jgi:predicted ATP-grasp superfamily ATP-dependent carboligase
VFIARGDGELQRAFATARRETGRDTQLLQTYVEGVHTSVSLLTDGMRCLPLTLNLQELGGRTRLRYHGGRVPLDHSLCPLAFRRAGEVVRAIHGLMGYVGIDMVLTDRDAVVIEVNPRVTTSYVGLRKVLRSNPAALMLEAARGNLPDPGEIEIVGTARFTTRSTERAGRRSARWSA